MPGSGRKVFAASSVLSSSDVQNYLQDQAVMVFAGTAARGSALGAGTVSAGMVSYLTDVDQIQHYDGSKWLPLPYAVAVGTASATTGALAINTQVAVNVTFPANRFSVAPVVFAWTTGPRYIAFASTVAAGSATITVRNVSDATGADETVYYQAIQMTSGTAVG